ncbi:MAG TPA: hypothetical protein PKL73_24310 [Polyangiaceae bacterium]|nr:MAG: hypothetical protein BWY17_04175 [Deltaproteobacteria bacterium ADurb.Bin207]HNT00106.1 hypothetical protein [Polyangiaceae bacterium]HNZ25290.1 hypothetical protein [Polyangiaceae bacterium]HOD24504.1 hypothetical protein [Polyangiaceae bacterium]HOE50423.1 hypothetical protein [Polyangiaceae bacterium]
MRLQPLHSFFHFCAFSAIAGVLTLAGCSDDDAGNDGNPTAGGHAGKGGSSGSSGAGGSHSGGSGGSQSGGAAGSQTGGAGGNETGGSGGSVTGGSGGSTTGGSGGSGTGGTSASGGSGGSTTTEPPAGNPYPEATCTAPPEAGPEDVSHPTTVVGDGTAASCTSAAVVSAIAQGGIITFDCGPAPIVITLEQTAKIFNDTGPNIVIDGGGLVTLDGGGQRRILYMNTCDEAQKWTTPHCQNQDHPRLTVQNINFSNGNSKNETQYDGGGAIWVRGGRFKLVNTRFLNNTCADTGPDLGGAAVRVLSQFENKPVYVVNSTFGGDANRGGICSNGGAISSIGVSWTIINSLFSYNRAIGHGANPAQPGTPGGGSGGAIYNDGNTMTLSLCGTRIEHNQVNAHGSAIFFVSNDHSGDIWIDRSVIKGNTGGSWYPTYPQISNHSDTPIHVTDSVIEE